MQRGNKIMARSARQSKIIEIITNAEIETQEDLVSALNAAGFDATQATISRDIKELGLIKIVGEKKKHKYAFVGNDDQAGANKVANVFKEAVIWVKTVSHMVVLKTVRGAASAVSGFIDKLSLDGALGCVYGDDTVMVITESQLDVPRISARLKEIIGLN